jgi:phage terminase large subunit
MTERHDLAEALSWCHNDLGLFHELVLGRPPLFPMQERVAASVSHNRWTVVPTCHGVGKTWLAPSIVLGWLYTRPGSIVVTTSPSNTQLTHALWGGIKAAWQASRYKLAGRVTSGHNSPQLLEIRPKWYAIGFSTRKSESFQGQRPDNGDLLVVVDEASGVEDPVWHAIESLGATSNLVLGNPIRSRCHFRTLYDLARSGTPGYASFTLSALESPHARLTTAQVLAAGLPRGLIDLDWIEDKRKKYGEGSIYWRTRVLSLFPDEDHDQLLSELWIDRCMAVKRAAGNFAPALIVDIAKGTGRDRTVVLVADYLGIRELAASADVGVAQAALLAVTMAKKHGVQPANLVYDAGGWAGTDMRRYLDQYGFHAARGYHGSGAGGGLYTNLRTRCAWRLRHRLDPDRPQRVKPTRVDPYQPPRTQPALEPVIIQPPFHIPPGLADWGDLRQELLELRYGHQGAKIALEKKEDMAQRLGRSPDVADVLLMLASLWPDDD